MKKIGIIALFAIIALASLTAVPAFYQNNHYNASAALMDYSISVSSDGPIKSDDYAYYYQGSGSYAEDAYWWSRGIDGSLTVDVKKLYNNSFPHDSDYSLKDFKKDLKKNINNLSIAVFPYTINDTDVTASLDDDSNTLYISFSGYEENYANQKMAKANVKESSNVKNVTARMIFNRDSEHADFDYDFDFANLTVSHS